MNIGINEEKVHKILLMIVYYLTFAIWHHVTRYSHQGLVRLDFSNDCVNLWLHCQRMDLSKGVAMLRVVRSIF